MSDGSRGNWQSQFGFIAAAAGSAVGLGNIWKFPYMAGQYGGGAFVFVYLIFLVLIGVPVLNSELLLGRTAQKNAVGTFKTLAPGTPWQIVGWMGVLTGFIILSYYSVVGGWVLSYVFKGGSYMAAGAETGAIFGGTVGSVIPPIIWHAIFMGITILIVVAGVEKGIERYSKVLMPALVAILIILIARSVTLEGSGAGLSYYLKPDFSKLSAEGILAALGQVFFTLSLGMGCMITYGSYVSKKDNIPSNSYWIAGMDTLIALMAGLAILPAVFAFGFEPTAGPGLTFVTLPAVFNAMGPMGLFFGTLFFILLGIAGITSSISLLEVVSAYFIDEAKWNRKKAAVTMGIVMFVLGIPSSLSLGPWANFHIIGERGVFDSLDYLASNILLPLGGILVALFIGWYWGTDKALEEGNVGATGVKLGSFYAFMIKYIIPVAIFIVFLRSIGVL